MTEMSKQPLTDFFKNTVRRMVRSIGQYESGNIYSLLISQVEKSLIEIVLEEQGYNYYHTARVLGIGRSTLYRKMEILHIDPRPQLNKVGVGEGEPPVQKTYRAQQG
ncbi:MAG: Fis family transcriptional regulator, factor for inversion stimulation protein [Candidatus Dependentiae bacterium]|nr:Fis family transcriptional regulator, factor for inversion stimulation protein [Candidatus Dependentiae bacterium]